MEEESLIERVFSNRKLKILTLLIVDFLLILVAYFLAFIFRLYLDNNSLNEIIIYFKEHIFKVIFFAIIYILSFYINKQYKSVWTLAGMDEVINGVIAVIMGITLTLGISLLSNDRIPLMVNILAGIMILVLCNGVRIGWRVLRRAIKYTEIEKNKDFKNVLIVGAGSCGALVANEYKKHPNLGKKVVAFIDDDKQKLRTYVNGIKVLGNRNNIIEVAKAKKVDEIIKAFDENCRQFNNSK